MKPRSFYVHQPQQSTCTVIVRLTYELEVFSLQPAAEGGDCPQNLGEKCTVNYEVAKNIAAFSFCSLRFCQAL